MAIDPLSSAAQVERPVPDQAASAAREKVEAAPGSPREAARPTPAAAHKAHAPGPARGQTMRQAAPKGSARKPQEFGSSQVSGAEGTEFEPGLATLNEDRVSALPPFFGYAEPEQNPGREGQAGLVHDPRQGSAPTGVPPDPAARSLFQRSLASAQAAALRRQHEAGRPTRRSLPIQKHFAGHSASARSLFQRSLASLHAATLRKGHEARTGSVSPGTGEPPPADHPPIASVQAASLRKGNEARRAARPRTLRQAGEGQRTLKPGPRWSPSQP